MAARVGDRLDDALFRRLSGEGLTTRAQEAILVATTDEGGRAHPALLAYGEILAVSPSLVRLAVAARSTTARNLAARGAVTVCLLAADGAFYVKGTGRALAAEPSLSESGIVAFEMRVEDVLADTPAAGEAARLTGGITFTRENGREPPSRLDSLRRA